MECDFCAFQCQLRVESGVRECLLCIRDRSSNCNLLTGCYDGPQAAHEKVRHSKLPADPRMTRFLPRISDDPHASGILVHGDNHFIVCGPLPDRATSLALVRHWSIIQIGSTTPENLRGWTISTREFRENLQWAVVVAGESETSAAVARLLGELKTRGITIHNSSTDEW